MVLTCYPGHHWVRQVCPRQNNHRQHGWYKLPLFQQVQTIESRAAFYSVNKRQSIVQAPGRNIYENENTTESIKLNKNVIV
jgi:hypothetical protein